MEAVYILSAVRTAVGRFGGSLKDTPPTRLATAVSVEALQRAGTDAKEVEQACFGQVIQTDARDPYFSRVVALEAGLAPSSSALTVNRLCASGLQAVLTAAQSLERGDTRLALVGGGESMSRAPFILSAARFGIPLGGGSMTDMLQAALTDPFGHGHMGITAENVAERYSISREQMDAFALESHQRAARAIRESRFAGQILAVETGRGRKSQRFAEDEQVRFDASPESLKKLKPVFREDGKVTAGNSSGINDGAAALVMAGEREVRRRNARPMARMVSCAVCGVAPELMGTGPIPASGLAMERAGINAEELDVIESNEAFAAQACAVNKALELDPAKVNPNGGAVALGHPIGATGAILVVKALHELERIQGRLALVTLCVGGGQGIAAIFERC